MVKSGLTYTVTVNKDELFKKLPEIISDVSELSDLVPEWSSLEAEQIEMRIYETLSDLIEAKRDG